MCVFVCVYVHSCVCLCVYVCGMCIYLCVVVVWVSISCHITFHQALSSRMKELERLRSEWTTHSATIRNECTAQLTAEKEKALQVVDHCNGVCSCL